MIEVYGIGALNLDFIYEVDRYDDIDVPGLALTGGAEIVGGVDMLRAFTDAIGHAGTLRKVSPGGSASNTCHALARMGHRVGLVGVIGRDVQGDTCLKEADTEGVDTEGVVRKGRTGLAYIVNSGQVDRSIVLFPEGAGDLLYEEVDRERLARARWVHMTSFVSPASRETQLRVKGDLVGRVPFSIDPGEIYAAMGRDIHPLIAGSEILFTSRREIETLFGCDRDRAIEKALCLTKIVVLKEGKDGASLFMEGSSCAVAAGRVHVVDNTGAGDVLNGVFLGLHLRGVDGAVALRIAVAAATASVTGYGRDAYPDRQAIEVLYEDMLVHDGKG
ncbi:MAG: carbohydrate kinase family protein [Syntrophorhabdales bacterium]|jgi:ribokinase